MLFSVKNSSYYTVIAAVSFLLSACYVYEWHARCESSYLFPEHASQVGYNFYKYSTITRLYEGSTYKYHGVVGTGQMFNRAPNMKDTIGYGVLLGLLWKVTGTTSFYWVILLQVLLFGFSLCLLFQALVWFLGDKQKALYAICGILAFLPASYLNVQPVKDMWSFYGTVVLLFVLIGLINQKITNKQIIVAAVFFALCQWLRPTVFGVLLALLFVGLPLFYFYFKEQLPALKKVLTYFFLANLLVFWVPFITYNKITFNRFLVGPTGLALLVSFSDSPNLWGVKCSEDWVGRHVEDRYPDLGYKNETPEFDDAVKKIFLEYFKEDPLLYFKNLAKRIAKLFIINLPWTAQFEEFWEYAVFGSKIEAFKNALQSGFFETIRCIIFFLYIRFFLLLSYIGIFLSFKKRQYLLPTLILLSIAGNSGEILSHIEGKYFMQSFGLFGIFAGLLVFDIKNILRRWYAKK